MRSRTWVVWFTLSLMIPVSAFGQDADGLLQACLDRKASTEEAIDACIAYNAIPDMPSADKSAAYTALAVARFNQGTPWLAISEATLSLQYDHENHFARYIRARGMLDAEQYEGAMTDFTAVAERADGPLGRLGRGGRGLVLWIYGQDVEALAEFATAMQGTTGQERFLASLYEDRAMIWLDLKDYGAALADLDGALDLDRTSVLALDLRGLTRSRIGVFNRAISDYERAIEHSGPNGVGPLYRLAWLLATGPRRIRDGERAVKLARKALDRSVRSKRPPQALAQSRHVLAAALVEAGHHDDAIRTYEEVMLNDPRFIAQYHEDLADKGFTPGALGVVVGDAMKTAIAACVRSGSPLMAERWCGYEVAVPCRDAFR